MDESSTRLVPVQVKSKSNTTKFFCFTDSRLTAGSLQRILQLKEVEGEKLSEEDFRVYMINGTLTNIFVVC